MAYILVIDSDGFSHAYKLTGISNFYGKKVAILVCLMKVQAWLDELIMIFISDNLIVVLQFGNSLLQVHCNPLT